MAFKGLSEDTFSVQLFPITELKKDSLNPRDYLDYSTLIKVRKEPLAPDNATIQTASVLVQDGVRLMADDVDRATGEVGKGHEAAVQTKCVPFRSGDLLLHKYAVRIGRIGIARFDGNADSHFMVLKPQIGKHFLLLALRSRPVLVQLPFREVARPGVWKTDIERCKIPRLNNSSEGDIEEFLEEIYALRARAKQVIFDVHENFDQAVQKGVPKDNAFLHYTDELVDDTLDPGHYFLKALELLFPDHVLLDNEVHIDYPSSLNAGTKFSAMTLADYDRMGIMPLNPKSVENLWDKNYAEPSNIILNRLQSGEQRSAKAVVVLAALDYLKDLGVTVRVGKHGTEIAVYDQLFILSMKKEAQLSPHYLSLFFNSVLFQHIFEFMMGGSTGRQRIRKTKLKLVRVPTFREEKMEAFSEALRICMEILSETFRMLLTLSALFERVVIGDAAETEIKNYIKSERRKLSSLSSKAVPRAQEAAKETEKLVYVMGTAKPSSVHS